MSENCGSHPLPPPLSSAIIGFSPPPYHLRYTAILYASRAAETPIMSSDLPAFILLLATLLALVALTQPLATRLKLPASVLLAALGSGLGFGALYLLYSPLTDRFDRLVAPLVDLPLHSDLFLTVFLPLLLFQASLSLDVRRMLEDAAPILLLAVGAVLVATAVIGGSLHWLFGVPLVVALLLGSIVATTDPAAVVAIFREIGAPPRLTRLVEGESLLNDAAAIALFTLLLAILTTGAPFRSLDAITLFLLSFLGGALFGILSGRLVVALFPWLGGSRTAEATLTLAAPYIVYIIADGILLLSGVVAVVVLALTIAWSGRYRLTTESWRYLEDVWTQVAFWASSLVFLLAALLVPRLLVDVGWQDVLMILTVTLAALLARAVVLFGLLPLLSLLGLAERINFAFKSVILWGGLRGAVTLALALAITEHPDLDAETTRLVGVLATGFVLFTLFINGPTLRPTLHLLGVDRLNRVEDALRRQILALSLGDVREQLREAGNRFKITPSAVETIWQRYDERVTHIAAGINLEEELSDRERFAVALLALTNRERTLVLAHHGGDMVSPVVIERLLRDAERIFEQARSEGRLGYARAARSAVGYSPGFRFAHLLHRSLGLERPLANRLAERFEGLMVARVVLNDLSRFSQQRLRPLLGMRITELAGEMLEQRLTAIAQAQEALRLQYPDYAVALEQRFLRHFALCQELSGYQALRAEGLIAPEIFDALQRGVAAALKAAEARPQLDLGLDVAQMIDQIPAFAALSEGEMQQLATLFRPQVVLPGDLVVRRGERGRAMYFIASGAVEVRFEKRAIRLGRGDFFGEMSLLDKAPRRADIQTLGYCHLLRLDQNDFERFLALNPTIRTRIYGAVQERKSIVGL